MTTLKQLKALLGSWNESISTNHRLEANEYDCEIVEDAIAEMEAKDKEIERLRGALKTIQIASEFHSQEGLADYVMRYAHESTFRLATQALGGNDG